MVSPFPGVDPFLEDQGLWPDFHHTFVNYWREAISDRLPSNYTARIDERFEIIEQPSRQSLGQRLPDISILEHEENLAGSSFGASSAPAGALVLEPIAIPHTITEEHRESFIEIRRLPDRKLVTVLELLSPTNKEGSGYLHYLTKRQEIFRRDVHLVELDFLLHGERVPLELPLPPGDFFAFVSFARRHPLCNVYAWGIQQPCPAIPIPLQPEDGFIWTDLNPVYHQAFDRGRFARELDYARPLRKSLRESSQAWLTTRLGEVSSKTVGNEPA